MPLYLPKGTPQSVIGSGIPFEITENPVIMTKSYVIPKIVDFERSYANITVSSGNSTKVNMMDRDPDTIWESVGSDDITTESIIVEFFEGSQAVTRSFDRVLLVNHNLKKFTLQYWTGTTWANIPEIIITDNGDGTNFYGILETSTTKIKLLMYETISPNAEKQIAEFWIMKEIIRFEDALDAYNPVNIEKGGEFRLSGGDLRSWTIADKYTVKFAQVFVSDIQRESFRDLYFNYDEFTWYPDPESDPDLIYLVQWMSQWSDPYSSKYKGAGFTFDISLQEV